MLAEQAAEGCLVSRFGPQGDHRLNLGAAAGLGGRSRSDADGPYLALVGRWRKDAKPVRLVPLGHLTHEQQLEAIERIKPQWEAEGLRVEKVT